MLRRPATALILTASLAVVGVFSFFNRPPSPLPGTSYRGSAPPLGQDALSLREELRADVQALAVQIGERNTHRPLALEAAADHLETRLVELGHQPSQQVYRAGGLLCRNLYIDLPGTDPEAGQIDYDSLTRLTLGLQEAIGGID